MTDYCPRDDVQAKVCRVFVLWQLKTQGGEVRQGGGGGSQENSSTLAPQEEDFVEHGKDSVARLVHHHHDVHPQVSHPAHQTITPRTRSQWHHPCVLSLLLVTLIHGGRILR